MLTEAFPKLNNSRAVQQLRAFLRSGWFIGVIAVLMACSELFSLELYVICAYVVLGLLIVLVCEDTLPVVPMVVSGYMLFSSPNNPGMHPDGLFSNAYAQYTLVFAIAVIAVLLAGRLVSKLMERKKRGVPKLLVGFVLLGAAYLMGGLASPYYDGRSVFFGFVQIAALCGFYFYLYFTVDWEKAPEGYVALLFTIIGAGVLAQVVGMYFNPGALRADGTVDRNQLYTGWGVWNCVGCVMAMCMPAPVYFAVTKKNGWIYTLISCIYFLGVILTQSRGSILFATVIFLACVVYTLVKARGREKLWSAIVYGALAAGGAVAMLVFSDRLGEIFRSLLDLGLNDSDRFNLYERCWNVFRRYPSFGVGWYDVPGKQLVNGQMLENGQPGTESYFIPGFAHNTFFQLIACGGVFAFIAYLIHRAQTVLMVVRDPSPLKVVAFLCIGAMLLTSFVDNHVFNMGPGILYSVLLVFSERERAARPSPRRE